MNRETMRTLVREAKERQAVNAPPTAEQAEQLAEATALLLQRVAALEARSAEADAEADAEAHQMTHVAVPSTIVRLLDAAEDVAKSTDDYLTIVNARVQVQGMLMQIAETAHRATKKRTGKVARMR